MTTTPVTTYLDFGMVKRGKRACYDYREGQQAYDLFMGARYLNDLIAYRAGRVDAVYHPEDLRDNLRKHTALTICRRDGSGLVYREIGSSVMGAIDAVNHLDRLYQSVDTRQVTWSGADNSPFMNAMAQYTHEGYDLRLSDVVVAVSCDVFFAKGVSLLYAVHTEELLAQVLDASRIAVFDYTFTTGQRLTDVVGTGLPVTFLNLDACRERLEKPGKTLRLEPYTIRTYHLSPDKVTFECLYGDRDLVDRYTDLIEQRSAAFESMWGRPLIRPST